MVPGMTRRDRPDRTPNSSRPTRRSVLSAALAGSGLVVDNGAGMDQATLTKIF
jgi:hypothetical protein